MGDEATCEAKPTEFPEFTMEEAWGSAKGTAATWSRVAVGDVDGDGIPEIIVTNRETSKMYILDGRNGDVKQEIKLSYQPEHGVALGKIKGETWFFVSGRGREIEGYKFNGTQFIRQWAEHSKKEGSHEKGRPMVLGLADFKGTGDVQLYYKNEIRDAATGTRLVNGVGKWEYEVNFAPVAVDILENGCTGDCSGLELVSGGIIYSVDLGNGSKDNGKLTVEKSIPNYSIKESGWTETFSSTSVADYNQDGHLDVIATGTTNGYHGKNKVFFWDVHNNIIKTFEPDNNWKQGMGRPNIADIDGNGKLNITFVSGNRLYALDENLNPLAGWEPGPDRGLGWIKINENTSGFTGTSVFDFNGDGAYEIVYRDEKYLYIISGKNGEILSSEQCNSRTSSEYPVVADVNGDGGTEICVVCNYDDEVDASGGNPKTAEGHVRVYKSKGEIWVPSRKVWNQHTYFNVNINDDLTIPRQQQKHHIQFQGGKCDTNNDNRPLNTFLNQSPYLNIHGCPTYGAPDFTVLDKTLKVTTPTCPVDTFNISFSVRNDGDVGVSGSVPITFYDGNPVLGSGKKLNTVIKEVKNLSPGEELSFNNLTVIGTGGEFTLFISFNDAGKGDPPITLPNGGGILECNYDHNIIEAKIIPEPFDIVVEKSQDNISCGNEDEYNNGSAKAYVLDDGKKITVGYTFKWYKGNSVKSHPDHEGSSVTGLSEGTYTVQAFHNEAKCGSITKEIVIDKVEEVPKGVIEIVQNVTKCEEADGELSAYVLKDGKKLYEEDGYNFTWYYSNSIYDPDAIVSTGHKATGLTLTGYSVVITDEQTGCVGVVSETVGSDLITPIVSVDVTDIVRCEDKGILKASVDNPIKGHTYTFKWYNGDEEKPTPDYEESEKYIGLAPGKYTVVAIDEVTGCASIAKLVTIKSKVAPPKVAEETIVHPTTCAGATPNGSISLSVSTPSPGSEPTGSYTIQWFKVNGASRVAVPAANITASGKKAHQLSAGTYTAVVTHPQTDCSEEISVILTDKSQAPVLTAKAFTNTICDPALNYDGYIETTLKVDGNTINDFANYTFEWVDMATGSTLTAATPGKLENLKEGKYSVKAYNTLGCISNTAIVEVKEDKTYPTITVVPDALQTSCDDTQPNGKLSATINGNANDYTFEWFEGDGTHTPLSHGTVSGSNNEVASGLKKGRYTVRATSKITGCSATEPAFVDENINYPIILSATITKNTVCDLNNDGNNLYDGKISLEIVFDDQKVNDFSDYTFTWYEGATASGTPITSATSATLSNVKEGQYTVVVSHDDFNCTAQEATYKVGDGTSKPVVTIVEDAVQTSCDTNNPNGKLSAHVKSNTSDYTFAWYKGEEKDIAGAGTIGNSYELAGQARGWYTVVVTSKATGCVGTNSYYLEEKIHTPSLALDGAVTHFTNCSAADGAIDVTVTDNGPSGSGYTYTWYSGGVVDATKVITGETGPSISSLTPGKYTVVVTNNFTHCTSVSFTEEVLDNTIPLTVEEDITVALACNDGSNNTDVETGAIKLIKIDGIPLPDPRFDFEWFAGSPTDPNATFYTDPAVAFLSGADNFNGNGQKTYDLKDIASGTYSVVITDNNTQCKTIRTYNVPFIDSEEFDKANTTVTHSTVCYDTSDPTAHGNGTIELQLKDIPLGYSINDYKFRWYEGNNVDESERMPNDTHFIDNLSPGTYTAIAIRNFGAVEGCQIADITLTIKQIAQPPVVTEDITDNTYCVGSNGKIKVVAKKKETDDDESSGYSFKWYAGKVASGQELTASNLPTPSYSSTLSNQPAGDYTVRVTNLTTGCFVDKTYTIGDDRTVPKITAATFDPQDICDPSGRIEIENAHLAPGNVADYTFTWYRGGKNSTDIINGVAAGPILDKTTYSDMGAGTYYVTITAKDGTGCTSAPYEVIIDDNSVELQLAFTQTSNTACDLDDVNGALTATATTIDPNSSATDLSFTWHIVHDNGHEELFVDGTHGSIDNSIGLENTLSDVKPGKYKVFVKDTRTGCSITATWTVKDQPIMPEIDTYTALDQDICDPSGSIVISNMKTGSTNDYVFTWYRAGTDVNNIIPGITGAELNNITYPAMGAGTYYVKATTNVAAGKGCETGLYEIKIGNKSEDPAIEFAQDANTACDLNAANGTLTATATTDGNPVGAGSVFEWFIGEGTDTPLSHGTVNTNHHISTVEGLKPGVYTVKVTDQATGCFTTAFYTVEDKPIYPAISGVTVQHEETCALPGSIAIDGMASGSLTDYSFTWYRGGTGPENVIPGVTSPNLNRANYPQMGAGTYYVVAITNSGDGAGCGSLPYKAIIDNKIPPLHIETLAYKTKTNCIEDNGELSIIINGDNDFAQYGHSYEINWYKGNIGDTPVLPSALIHEIKALAPGKYTVEVVDKNTDCSVSKTFMVEDKTVYPIINTSKRDVTSCYSDNGEVFAVITNKPSIYTYTWYVGKHNSIPTAQTPIGTTQRVTNLSAGDYTVFATDQSSDACGEIAHVTVEEKQIKPDELTVIEDSPLTNCDTENPGKSNGQLSASVGGNISHYTFEWYLGDMPKGAPVYTGPVYSGLTNTTYTVKAINNVSGCFAYKSHTVTEDQAPVQAPEVTVTNRTNCDFPNGQIMATVADNVNDYRFSWYRGNVVKPSAKLSQTSPLATGLDAGTYTVTVTYNPTGCISAPVIVTVDEVYTYPEFDIITENSSCQEPNGLATLNITQGNSAQIIWETPNGFESGIGTRSLPAGNYSVTIVSIEGCSTTKDFTIGTDISVYNGVSPNGDGKNDRFEIDCIMNFPYNTVKIFNRTGTLVFEMEGYDNDTKFFEGKGNRGLYLVGNDLPDGTYFYVIEKNDGSKPKTGYLELLR